MGDGKRFRAYEIVKSLKEKGKEETLRMLREAVEARTSRLKALGFEKCY